MYCSGTLISCGLMKAWTRLALEGVHVTRMTMKKRIAHFVYCQAALLIS